jgi:Protein of unknown function (DUF3017)
MVRWEVPPERRVAFTIVLVVVALSVAVTYFVDFRVGGYILAASLGLAALFRAVLPERYCLGLLVRTRRMDVASAAVLGAAVAVVAAIVPG